MGLNTRELCAVSVSSKESLQALRPDGFRAGFGRYPSLAVSQVGRCAEHLDRGVVALRLRRPCSKHRGGGCWLPTRRDIAFHVARAESADGPWQNVTSKPIHGYCNFVDATGQRPARVLPGRTDRLHRDVGG